MYKLGVGIKTYADNDILEVCLREFVKHSTIDNLLFFVACEDKESVEKVKEFIPKISKYRSGNVNFEILYNNDSDKRLGVAGNFNRCIKVLKDKCEKFVIVDNDFFPVTDGWDSKVLEIFNDLSERGFHSFLFAPCTPAGGLYKNSNTKREMVNDPSFNPLNYNPEMKIGNTNLVSAGDVGGFIGLDTFVIDRIGGMASEFKDCKYGFEHVNYAIRLVRSKLMPYRGTHVRELEEYIYSPHFLNPAKVKLDDEVLKLILKKISKKLCQVILIRKLK